tara:strand:+ start:8352 stop:8573 length:222 start_codon:yes stop_codon:yes gene_type:complete
VKTHYRKVSFEKNFFTGISITSIKIPCGSQGVVITRDSTKNKDKVTCSRCLAFLASTKEASEKQHNGKIGGEL